MFLGDNGSMLLGLLLASLLIDMSQGASPVIDPVVAVWPLAVPLMDTIGVMLRRLLQGKSPFTPDRYHLHHLLQQAGFRVDDIVAIVAGLQLLLGLFGVGASALGVGEGALVIGNLALFGLYFALTVNTTRAVTQLRRMHEWMGLLPAASCGLYVGHDASSDARHLIDAIAHELGQNADVHVRIYEHVLPDGRVRYALVDIKLEDESATAEVTRRYVRLVRRRLREHQHVRVRPLIKRSRSNERRSANIVVEHDRRDRQRRDPKAHVLIAEIDAHVGDGRITVLDVDAAADRRRQQRKPVADTLHR